MCIIQARLTERRNIRLWRRQWRVRRVGRQVAEERLIASLLNKGHCLVKKQILTEPFALCAQAVANDLWIEVLTRPHRVGGTPIEAAMLRIITRAIPQMPFTNKPRSVTRGFQQLRQSHRILK